MNDKQGNRYVEGGGSKCCRAEKVKIENGGEGWVSAVNGVVGKGLSDVAFEGHLGGSAG